MLARLALIAEKMRVAARVSGHSLSIQGPPSYPFPHCWQCSSVSKMSLQMLIRLRDQIRVQGNKKQPPGSDSSFSDMIIQGKPWTLDTNTDPKYKLG